MRLSCSLLVEGTKMNLSEKLRDCQDKYNKAQVNAVVNTFNRANKKLAARSQATGGNASGIKSHLDKLNDQINANDTPAEVKTILEESVKKLERKYKAQEAVEAKIKEPIDVELVWNSSNGNKELLLPLKYKGRPKKRTPSERSLIDRIYLTAYETIMAYDIDCDVEAWGEYTKVISRYVAGNKEKNLPAKLDVIQLAHTSIEETIKTKIGKDLENANVNLQVINSIIKSSVYDPVHKELKKEAKKEEQKAEEQLFATLKRQYKLLDTKEVSAYLGTKVPAINAKIKNRQVHAIMNKSKWHIPEHDLITYEFGHPRTGGEGTGAHKFSRKLQELTEGQFEKYKSKVGEVCRTSEAGEMLGITSTTVSGYIAQGRLHGVKYKAAWHIPKKEIEFHKDLQKAGIMPNASTVGTGSEEEE
jgi:predicted transcriptional regulator